MTKPKAGVIGAGAFGRHHARKYAEDDRVVLAGIYDPDDERAHMLSETHHVSAFGSPEALIAACDLVTIASPATTHAAMARLALDSGRHVLTEKPLATSVADGEELVARARAQNVVLACGHQERLVAVAMGLFAVAEKPLFVECVRAGPWTGRGVDVSATLDLMTHDIDLALALIGDAPISVSTRGVREQGAIADHIEAEAKFANGAAARFMASRIAEERARSLRAVYPSGEVRVDFVARSFHNSTPFPLNANFAETPEAHDPLGANVRRFIDAALGAASRPAVTGAEALDALRLADWFDRDFVKGQA